MISNIIAKVVLTIIGSVLLLYGCMQMMAEDNPSPAYQVFAENQGQRLSFVDFEPFDFTWDHVCVVSEYRDIHEVLPTIWERSEIGDDLTLPMRFEPRYPGHTSENTSALVFVDQVAQLAIKVYGRKPFAFYSNLEGCFSRANAHFMSRDVSEWRGGHIIEIEVSGGDR